MKKLIALVLALAMVATLGLAFATPQTEHGTEDTSNNGSITISNATIGKKYSLYKLFDATLAVNTDGTAQVTAAGKPIINYTVPTGKTIADDNAWFAVTNGNVTIKSGADITTDAFKTWATDFGTEIKKDIVATDSSLTIDQLPYGYYYIVSEVGGTLTIDSTTPHADVIDKNQDDSFDKYIVEGSDHVTVNEAGLSETVSFEIPVNGVNYIGEDKVYKYVIKDTIQNGFTYDAAPTVTVAGAAPAEAVTINYKDKDGTATTDLSLAQSFEIVVPWAVGGVYGGAHLYASNAQILVTYTAHLDANKFNSILVGGSTGNENKATVEHYKAHETPTTETPEGVGPDKDTHTFTTSLLIKKIDGTSKNPLKGAEFTLTGPNGPVTVVITETFVKADDGTYWKLKNGTYTTQDPNGTINGNPVDKSAYESETDKYKATTVQTVKNSSGAATGSVAEVGEDGLVKFSGLAAGDYTLSETKVPAGYNKIADITFTISFDADEKEFSSTELDLDGTTNTFKTTIENNRGTELPSTGGIGTTIFYILGGLLVVGAAVILVARRKASEN